MTMVGTSSGLFPFWRRTNLASFQALGKWLSARHLFKVSSISSGFLRIIRLIIASEIPSGPGALFCGRFDSISFSSPLVILGTSDFNQKTSVFCLAHIQKKLKVNI